MLPSWFTRLRDVKAGSKHKEQNKLCVRSPSPSAKRCNNGPASFAKSWSLQRANNKAKNARIEADNTSACNDLRPYICDVSMPLGGAQSVCNLQALELGKDAVCMDTLLMHHCALAQKGHGVSDNDTEDFTLTSETRSSFCSETSSADSSVSCKSGCEQKGNHDERSWREGDDAIKSSGIVSENVQKICIAGENGCHGDESTTDMMSICCHKSVQVRRDVWRGRGSFLLSYLTAGQHGSVGSNAESRRVGCNVPSSTPCTHPESAEGSKRREFSMRRRRQRGASISAVLPPDLQGVVGDSLALVKMSDDPYEDFRQSIYEMIMEKDLEGSMDVEELLYCYLSLNAPEHHELIKEVFSDVWSAILMTLR